MKNMFRNRSSTEKHSSEQKLSVLLEPSDLCMPIYLNQQAVFDMLAVLDDGFSRLSNIKISSGETGTSKFGVGTSLGVNNVFALLGVSFSGERSKQKGTNKQAEVSQEKVHTPTSLFAKLKLRLREMHLLKKVDSPETLSDLSSGEFIEFRAILRKNPLADTIETLKTFIEMATLFTVQNDPSNPSKQKIVKPQNQNAAILKQMDGILSALSQSSSIELIGELLDVRGVTSVITARLEYFT